MSVQALNVPTQGTINAMFEEFARQTKQYINDLRANYELGITNQTMGGMEFNVPIVNVAQAVSLLPTNCTKLVDNHTEIVAQLSPFVDRWDAIEEVAYNVLRSVGNSNFEVSYAGLSTLEILTNCPNLKKIDLPLLREIKSDIQLYFAYNLPSIHSISANSLTSISSSGSGISTNNSQILSGLTSLTSLSLDSLTSISGSGYTNNSQILSGLTSLTSLSLDSLTSIISGSGSINNSQILSGLTSLTSLSLDSLTSISGSGYTNNSQILSGLTSLSSLFMHSIMQLDSSKGRILQGSVALIDLQIGHTTEEGYGSITSLNLQYYDPSALYGDADKVVTLNANFRNGVVAHLINHTGTVALPLTLASAFVAQLEQETIEAITNKNWTIVTI